MNYILYGTDARMKALACLLHREGHLVFSWEGVRGAYITPITSPLEVSLPVRLVLPPSLKGNIVKNALATLPLRSRIYGGMPPEDEESLGMMRRRALTWINLMENARYCAQNAVPTAEGALAKLIEVTPRTLAESVVCITGSGHVAHATVELLLKCGADVLVCARSAAKRKAFRERGCRTAPLPVPEKKLSRLKNVSALINTVPAEGIVGEDILKHLPRRTPILELASGKDNVCAECAAEYGHTVYPLPALPGKVAPESAARALFLAITEPEI